MPGINHLWFITFILICYLITPILQSLYNIALKNTTEIVFWARIFIVLGVLLIFKYVDFINIGIPNLMCYITGYFYSRRISEKNYKKSKININFIFIGIAIISNAMHIYLAYILKVTEIKYITLFFEFSHAFLGISLFIILKSLFDILFKEKNISCISKKILNYSDKYSFEIFIVHQVYAMGRFSLIKYIDSLPVAIISIFTVSILSGIILNNISGLIQKNI